MQKNDTYQKNCKPFNSNIISKQLTSPIFIFDLTITKQGIQKNYLLELIMDKALLTSMSKLEKT